MTYRDGKREEPGAGRGICTSRCCWRGGAVSALQSLTFPVHTSRNRGRWRRVRRREGGRGVVCLCPSAEAFALLQRQKVVLAWSCLGPLTGCGCCSAPTRTQEIRRGCCFLLAWSVLHVKLNSGQKDRTSLKNHLKYYLERLWGKIRLIFLQNSHFGQLRMHSL